MNKFIPVCEPYLNGNEKEYVLEALQSGWISSSGKYIKLFEEKFAEYCGAKYAVCAVNGTTAIHLALASMGIGKDDEVIIPEFTMIASAFAVCYTGAKPVFVDADKKTWNIDTKLIETKITKKTKAIMTVSIFGNPCDYDKINQIAKKYNLLVIEDAAESVGAEYKGIKTGNLANITAFSFFANKNLTTGEGGMITTNSEEFYNKARYYKNLCFPLDGNRNYIHNDVGFNYRMSNLHAAIGLAQVEKADYYKDLRIKNGSLYKKYLSDIGGIILQEKTIDSINVYWMNGLVVDPQKYGATKDELIAHLKSNNIDTRLFFNGMSKQPSLQKYGCDCSGDYPVTENLSKNGFYLPSASNLTEEKIKYICNCIKEFKK
ncbi:MAG: DegT/DnrJ/EryC1/StrS family aminotransferase [Spirochaetes bacterium]|nr:DegT/DnrJ/EryC1/StrS family aminotransferase [Spirochaetota bacterium]